MKFTRVNVLLSSVIIGIAIMLNFIKYQSIQWLALADTLFLMALPLLIVGLLGWVLSKEAFDFFHYSMRKTFREKKKKLDDSENSIDPHALSRAVGKSYQSILTIGFLILLVSILCLWDYFL